MESSLKSREKVRRKRTFRVRKKVRGTAQKPRLSVTRTNQHIHVQVIDDEASVTLASLSTNAKAFRDGGEVKKDTSTAKKLGSALGALALEKKIETCVFDRGRYKYHGVVAAVAEGAREAGLKF